MLKGDKFVAVKNMGIIKTGDIVEVYETSEDMTTFNFGKDLEHLGFMDIDSFEECFEEVEQEQLIAPKVDKETIQKIAESAEIEIMTVFDKCTIMAAKLPNGFVIVESSACVSPENYDEDLGASICAEKIIQKIWELEGYKLQSELAYKCHDYSEDDYKQVDADIEIEFEDDCGCPFNSEEGCLVDECFYNCPNHN